MALTLLPTQDVNVKMEAQAAERLKQAGENDNLREKLQDVLGQFETFNKVVGAVLCSTAAVPRMITASIAVLSF